MQNHMSVGAAKAERADSGQCRTGLRGPRTERRLHAERKLVEGNMRVGLFKVQARRDLPMPQRQRHLDQAGDTGGGLEVAQVGLDRPHGASSSRWTFDAQHRAQRLRLDRVAQQCARAVRLDVLHLAGRDAGLPVGFAQHRLLRQRVRRHQPVAASVLVHGAAANDGINRIAVSQRFRQRLQHDDAGTLAANVAVGPGIERLAAPIRRHGAGFGEIDRNRRRKNQVHAPGQSQRGLAGPQAAAGQVDGDE